MMIGGPTIAPPILPAQLPPVSEVMTDRRFSAFTNVLVFTPYAVYLARGKRPPSWLIAASLAYLAVAFFEDMRYLIQGEQTIASELAAFPPRPCGPMGCANGCGGSRASPTAPQSFPAAMQYRVNR